MRPDCPKIRDDLEYFPVEGQHGAEVIARDPIVHTYYRLDELQAKVIARLDGKHSLPELARLLAAELGAEIPVDALRELVARARGMGLLDVGSSHAPSPDRAARVRRGVNRRARKAGVTFRCGGTRGPPGAERRQRPDVAELFDEALRHVEHARPVEAMRALHAVTELEPDNARARYLKQLLHEETVRARRPGQKWNLLRFEVFNPEPALDWLLQRMRPVVSWKGYAALVAWFLFGAVLAYPRLGAMMADVGNAPRLIAANPLAPFVIYALSLVQFLGHEMLHGLACRRAGGRVPAIGILVAFLIFPGAYCETSATYTFPNKWDRVLVAAAGIGWQMLLYPLAVLVYIAAPRGTLLSVVALGELISCWGVVIFTAVPFFKSDGYYILADAVGSPRLWEVSATWARNFAKRLVLGVEPSPDDAARTRGAGLGVALYALAGVATTFGLTLTVYLTVSIPMMATAFRGPGLLLTLVPFSMVFLPPLARGVGFVWVHRAAVARSPRAWLSAGLLASLVGVAAFVRLPWSVEVPYEMLSDGSGWATLQSPADGVLASLEVQVGQRVKAGDVLASLDDTAARLAVLEAERDVEAARTTLAMRERLARERAESVAAGATYSRRLARLQAGRVRAEAELAKEGLASREAVDRARLRNRQAATASAETLSELKLLRAGLSQEERTRLEQEVSLAELILEQRRQALAALVLRAPTDGVVIETCAGRREVSPSGVVLARGAPVVRLRTDEPMVASLQVPIEYRHLVGDGRPVRMWVESANRWLDSTVVVPDFAATLAAREDTKNGFLVAARSLATVGVEQRGLVELRTSPVAVDGVLGRVAGTASITLAPTTMAQRIAWRLKYFVGYYWWSLW